MTQRHIASKSDLLTDLSPYIYGTTRLGDDKISFEERVHVARAAMQGTSWFHTSHHYGNALDVLQAAFDQDRAQAPKLIVKLGWNSMDEIRQVVHQHLDTLQVEAFELGQLCLSGPLADQ